jgi:hypothetical protein
MRNESKGCFRTTEVGTCVFGHRGTIDRSSLVEDLSMFYDDGEKQELPPFPKGIDAIDNPAVLLGGRAYKYLRLVQRLDPEKFRSFVLSVLYSKKGMPRPSKAILEVMERETFVKLTQVKRTKLESIMSSGEYLSVVVGNAVPLQVPISAHFEKELSAETMTHQLRRTVQEIFENCKYTNADRYKPYFPSTAANFKLGRNGGGTLGYIMKSKTLMRNLKHSGDLITSEVMGKGKSERTVINDSHLEHCYEDLYNRALREVITEDNDVTLVMLPESLKGRGISKGPALLYFVLKPLQKKLWGQLQKFRVFELTGKPVDADYVQEVMGAKLKDGKRFLSVDYSDATNELSSWASEVMIDEVCKMLNLTTEETRACFIAMTKHRINFNKKNPFFEPPREQSNGQLMGSIISFPFLCIANAAVCRWAMEMDAGRRIKLKDLSASINGDDAIMKCGERGREYWSKFSTFIGLNPSIGKVYFSKNFLNINSTTYEYNPIGFEGYIVNRTYENGKVKFSTRIRHFQKKCYINMGLLYGMKRSSLMDNDEDFVADDSGGADTVGSVSRELISTCPTELQEVVLASFIHRNGDKMKKYALPWFIPEQFGGLGLPSVGRFSANGYDLRVARKVYENPVKFALPSRPLDVPWKVWDYASKKFSIELPHLVSGIEGNMSFNDVIALYCIQAIFCCDLKDLFDKDRVNTNSKRYYSKVSKIWNKAYNDQSIKVPEPFNPTRFPTYKNLNDIAVITKVNL